MKKKPIEIGDHMFMTNLANISAIYPRSPMINLSRAGSLNEFSDNK